MFCAKCGAQIKVGVNFCSSCGETVTGQGTDRFAPPIPNNNGQPAEKISHKKIGMIACAVVLLIVAIGAIAIFGGGNDNRDRRLVGRWEVTEWGMTTRIEFRRDGTGVMVYSWDEEWEEEEPFEWETEDDSRLRLLFSGMLDDDWVTYEIERDILRIIYGWRTMELRRVR